MITIVVQVYFFKLFFFLITTSLLLMLSSSLLHPPISIDEFDEFRQYVELQVYRILFQIPTFESHTPFQDLVVYEEGSVVDLAVYEEDSTCVSEENPDGMSPSGEKQGLEDKEVIYCSQVEEAATADTDNNSETRKGSYGWTRKKAKSWKRTLECKLLEERYNVDAGEELMDSLWETMADSTVENCGGDEEKEAITQSCFRAFKFSSSGNYSSVLRFSKLLKRLGR